MKRSNIQNILIALSVMLLAAAPAYAGSKNKEYDSYAIPFSCGPNDSGLGGVVPGEYATAITLTNLGVDESEVRLQAQLTDPDSSPTDRIQRRLDAGHSVLIDCEDILDGLFEHPVTIDEDDFNQGVLTVDSRDRLSVVVQSTATGSDGEVSVHSRQVLAQTVKRKKKESKDDKVEICHIPPGNPDNEHTIEVDEDAVSSHMNHGDEIGECD